MPSLPPAATLLAEVRVTVDDWQYVTTIWQARDGSVGARIHAQCRPGPHANAGASLHVLTEGVATLEQLKCALSRDALDAQRWHAPAEPIRDCVARALAEASQTVTA